MPMPLNQLLPQAQSAVLIRALSSDSRAVLAGDLFLATQAGSAHIPDALARGAAAVAYEAQSSVSAVGPVPMLAIRDLDTQLSAIAGRFYGEPSRSMRLIGVTGTNGKTSVTQLLAQALEQLAVPCGVVGTLGVGVYGALTPSGHTTPDAVTLQAALAQLKQSGARAVALEVSSHGLHQHRVAALTFEVAVFTNLSRDHLDYHGTMERYGAVKAALFAWPELQCRVINIDDSFGQSLAQTNAPSRLIRYSIDNPAADLHCKKFSLTEQGIEAYLSTPQGEGWLRSSLLGRFNLSNLLAVVGALLGLGYPQDEVLAALPHLQPPAGRMQRLGGGDRPLVIVDYAHTPDALTQVLRALRGQTRGQLHCLFGCGGDRDRGKRAQMAVAAEQAADHVLVTDDNPRSEDPAQIFQDIQQGFSAPDSVLFVHDRARAIHSLIGKAALGDVVLIAGKGHEDYQDVQGVRRPFSDIQVATQVLAAWTGGV